MAGYFLFVPIFLFDAWDPEPRPLIDEAPSNHVKSCLVPVKTKLSVPARFLSICVPLCQRVSNAPFPPSCKFDYCKFVDQYIQLKTYTS